MAWLLLQLETCPEEAEALEVLLEEAGAVAITMEDSADQPLLEPGVGETPLWRRTRLTAMYPAGTDMETVLQALPAGLLSPSGYRVEILEERAWEREWMRHYRPMRFGERLWICPSWQAPPDPAAANLLLDPGLAFGTGTHPTTALCLGELAGMALDGVAAVDYGCGSGILAVAALKLGANRALGVDNDPQALAATRENAARNLIPETTLQVCLPEQIEWGTWTRQADVVIANILAGPLVSLSGSLLHFLRPGGTLLLAGMLESQAPSLCDHYAPHLALRISGEREGWVCLRGELPPQ